MDMVYYQKHKKPLFRRRSNLVKLLQAGLDVFGISGIFYALLLRRLGEVTPDETILLLILALIMLICYEYFGMYRSNANIVNKTAMLFRVWSISFMGFISAIFLTHQGDDYSGFFLLELYLVGFLAQMAFHATVKLVHHQLVRHSNQTSQALIVGDCPLAEHLRHKISSNLWMGEQVVGLVSLSATSAPAENDLASKTMGGVSDLPRLVDEYGVDVVYVVTPLALAGVLGEIYPRLMDKYVTIHWIPDIFSLRLVNHAVTELAGIPVLTLSETPLIGLNRLAKLIEDRVLSFLILLLIAPLLLVIAVLIKLDSPGPIFYRQKRAGWNGKIFRIWKFRSMYVQPEGETSQVVKQAEKDDPRVTRVGRFIRKTSLDELPQIFNVLLGDMSLVGPRPHAIQHDMEYSQRISDYFARHHIKPGITGLAQVRGLRGETKEISLMMRRVESDIEYINQWSIWLDIWILLRTIKVFSGKNAY